MIETHIIIHGLSAIAWMLLTIIQARLIKSGWRKYHRTVGYFSLILAAVVVVSGLQVLQTMILKEGGMVDGVPSTAIKFFYIDMTALTLFCVFLWLAIKAARRRDIALHLRLMACTAIIPLEAALERTYLYGTPTYDHTGRVIRDWDSGCRIRKQREVRSGYLTTNDDRKSRNRLTLRCQRAQAWTRQREAD